jgi:hypothetical protein
MCTKDADWRSSVAVNAEVRFGHDDAQDAVSRSPGNHTGAAHYDMVLLEWMVPACPARPTFVCDPAYLMGDDEAEVARRWANIVTSDVVQFPQAAGVWVS